MDYAEFLASKAVAIQPCGIEPKEPHESLFPFQRDIVKWALRRGRACIFADCGMGKSFMQLEWARQIPGSVLILAPLAVATQTVGEGKKLGIEVNYCRKMADVNPGITITNYEMLEHFDADQFTGVVLDESSIIKHLDGKTRNEIITRFGNTPYKLACTATPAPNDHMELGNHAEFVGAMTRTEMLSMFFVHDGGDTSKWRIKGHAAQDFWKWVCEWAVMIRKPSDLGYDDGAFTLPPITIEQLTVDHQIVSDGFLFPMPAQTLKERQTARRDSIGDRAAKCAEIVNASSESWLIWVNLNNEGDELIKAIPGAVQITGSESPEIKAEKMVKFVRGEIRILVSKSSICGFGMNFQHCHNVAFVGLSDSWEQYYQAVRRCWRFGQKSSVKVYIITSSSEGAVVQNIKRKEKDAEKMALEMVQNMHSINEANIKGTQQTCDTYKENEASSENWSVSLGDCVESVRKIPDEAIDFSIFSPPFASLYVYSPSSRDMGNSRNYDEFGRHFSFLVKELFRVLKPGRNISFHCMNLPTTKTHHGYIGIQDFRGDLIRMFQSEGFIYHSEVCIWKDPVTAMQRTKAIGLLWKQIKKDSRISRQGIPDYLVTMRKPGGNDEPVAHTAEEFPVDQWQQWASPVWMDINPSDTLQFRSAREDNDERHICPLQLEVIRRAMLLWSNPNDLILSPFTGIGSEGVVALENGRRFIGVELKESYWKQAVANLRSAEQHGKNDLFSQKNP